MVIAGVACGFAGLCYAELASMIRVAGSAYTYAYATVGELLSRDGLLPLSTLSERVSVGTLLAVALVCVEIVVPRPPAPTERHSQV